MQVFQLSTNHNINGKIDFFLYLRGECITCCSVDAMDFLKISKLDAETIAHHFALHGVRKDAKIAKNILSMVMEEPPVKSIKHVLELITTVVNDANVIFNFKDSATGKVVTRQLPHCENYCINIGAHEEMVKELRALYDTSKVDEILFRFL